MSKQEQIKAQLPKDFDEVRHLYYKKIIHPENERLKNHIFIRSNSIVRKVVAFSIDLILNKKFPNVILSAISKNMDKVVFIAELIKRKLKGLSQQTSLGTLEFQEVYKPKEHVKGEPEYLVKRKATILSVILDYRDTIDTNHYGYQRPLPLNQVSTKNPRDYVLMIINEYKNKRNGRWLGEKVYRKRGGRQSWTPEKREERPKKVKKQPKKDYEREDQDYEKKYPRKKKKDYHGDRTKQDYYDRDYERDADYQRDKRRSYNSYDSYEETRYDDQDYYGDRNRRYNPPKGDRRDYNKKKKSRGNYYY